jgi:hypothetical protein
MKGTPNSPTRLVSQQHQRHQQHRILRHADLIKFRRPDATLAAPAPGLANHVLWFLLRLLAVTLSRVSQPLGRLLGLYFWAGRMGFGLVYSVENRLMALVGWLAGRHESRLGKLLRFYFGLQLRRWHVAAGKSARVDADKAACAYSLLCRHVIRGWPRLP